MKLIMVLKNQLIDSIPLCKESISLPGYMGRMKRELQCRYAGAITEAGVEPEFLVVNASQNDGKTNKRRNRKS